MLGGTGGSSIFNLSNLGSGPQSGQDLETKLRYEKEIYETTSLLQLVEDQRISYVKIIEEADRRRAVSMFSKNWKSLRSYNACWAHPSFNFQNDSLFNKNIWSWDKIVPNRIFKLRINKQESKSKARYLLSTRLLEPQIVKDWEAAAMK